MKSDIIIKERVHKYYWDYDINCAATMLKITAEIFGIEISPQLADAVIGMHGAGKFGAQCGLVEGSLMLIGIKGRADGFSDDAIVNNCFKFADEFQKKFGSLNCSVLRPEGFKQENPPHLCEEMTVKAVEFTAVFVSELKSEN
jgi:C_GCAxxG_C_C family probable redox protein